MKVSAAVVLRLAFAAPALAAPPPVALALVPPASAAAALAQQATAPQPAAASATSTSAASSQASPRPPQPSMRGDGPAPASRPFSISRADPGIDALIDADARVELVASGFGLNERTTWVRDGKGGGFLLVAGLLDNVLYRIDPDNTEGTDGKRFSGPNDISIRANGAIYLTDNDFGLRGAGRSPLKEMPNGIFRIENGVTTRVLSDVELGGIPNGIAFSPDERYLYLTAGNRMMRYDVNADGTLGASTLFAEGVGIGDGMRVDTKGNVYSTGGAGPGTVRITSPDGKFLGTINLPVVGGEPKRQICSTNVAFGDMDARTLFVAACDAVYKIRLKVPGILQGPGS